MESNYIIASHISRWVEPGVNPIRMSSLSFPLSIAAFVEKGDEQFILWIVRKNDVGFSHSWLFLQNGGDLLLPSMYLLQIQWT